MCVHSGSWIRDSWRLVTDIAATLPRASTTDLGCPGETTTSMISGVASSCYKTTTSQLDAAVGLLKTAPKAKGSTLVTIDIGANDLASCLSGLTSITSSVATCIANATSTAASNLATILGDLKSANRSARIVGMNYYDPVLAAWLEPSGAGDRLAFESTFYAAALNQALDTVYSEFGVPVANVQGAFQTFDFFQYESLTLGTRTYVVPKNVYDICTLTYTCLSANPHPTDGSTGIANPYRPNGYEAIAAAFLQVGA